MKWVQIEDGSVINLAHVAQLAIDKDNRDGIKLPFVCKGFEGGCEDYAVWTIARFETEQSAQACIQRLITEGG